VPADPVLVLRRATVAYERDPVVEGVDGEVAAGQSVALIGPNGAGKSTLIRAVLGLVPLTGGTIQVLGRSPQAARRQVAYVPQADILDAEFPVSALQVVLMGRYPRVGWVRRPGPADRQAAARALAATDAFGDTYRQHRPMVERSIAWLVRGSNRRLRYRGTTRNRLWLGHRVAAVNLQRLVNLGLTHRAERWAIA